MRQMFEVKSGGYSLGITPWIKSAELWFKEAGNAHKVELLEIKPNGSKVVYKWRTGNGFCIRDISKGKSVT